MALGLSRTLDVTLRGDAWQRGREPHLQDGTCVLRLSFRRQGTAWQWGHFCSANLGQGLGSQSTDAQTADLTHSQARSFHGSGTDPLGGVRHGLSPLSEVYLRSWSAATAACVP